MSSRGLSAPDSPRAGAGVHERLIGLGPLVKASERVFGLTFGVVFSVAGLLPVAFGSGPRWWAFGVAGVFVLVALIRPVLLTPLNRVWFRIASVLGRILSVVSMALLFYGVVTPTGLVMRMLGKDLLCLRRDPKAASYWVHREAPGPPPDSMKNQF